MKTNEQELLFEMRNYMIQRNYKLLFASVEDLLMFRSWQEILQHVRGFHNEYEFLSEGVVREALLRMLALTDFNALDGNLMDIFGNIEGDCLQDLREQAHPIAFSKMQLQIRRGNTFFLDATDMAQDPELALLVPKILEVREKQMLQLKDNPPLSDIYSTYYGFQILTQGSIEVDYAGVTDEAIQSLADLGSQFGKDLRPSSRILRYSKTAFGRVSDTLRELLWHLLVVCAGGKNSRNDSIKTLGLMRDSRSIDILHRGLLRTEDSEVRRHILKALGRITHHESVRVLRKIDELSHSFKLRKLAREMLGNFPQHMR